MNTLIFLLSSSCKAISQCGRGQFEIITSATCVEKRLTYALHVLYKYINNEKYGIIRSLQQKTLEKIMKLRHNKRVKNSNNVPVALSVCIFERCFPALRLFRLCDDTPQKVVDGLRCLTSHFEDDGKDYYLASQFYHQWFHIFQHFYCIFIWGKISHFFKLYFLQTVLIRNSLYSYSKIQIIIDEIS